MGLAAALPLIGLATKIVGKILPGKSGTEAEKIATDIVSTDKGIREAAEKLQGFYLAWFAVDKLPGWAVAIKNLWRPVIALTYSMFTMIYFITHGVMPDKYFCLMTISIVGVFGISRGVEKIKKHIV